MCPVEGPKIHSVVDKQGHIRAGVGGGGEMSQKPIDEMDLPLGRQVRTGNEDSRSVHSHACTN